ncbi:TerB family tellurite resistance protein [Colwellia demingiae]|uniref:TerB family tellurite resistance protein n=1 Tax=Colwellia demingiae TaxID=89401 RepID=A0A5C6QS51_9GAMM|nr:TerB family tellurite resistance protein [Colwellia demingiae]TWX72076.1 TerB family tellurite resistance protein [Colwellia demingiae]
MLAKLRNFFSQELKINDQENTQDRIQLAAATLLIEVNRASLEKSSVEQQAIKVALEKSFNLSGQKLDSLVEHATAQDADVTSLYPFVKLINEHYSAQQKVQLVKTLWEVAIADQKICIYEEHSIRQISDLLHVPHSDFIQTKLKVLEQNT